MGREETIRKLKEICGQYADILGIVILFGSYSRDDADRNSDIDLYIEPRDVNMTSAKFGSNKRYKEFKYTLYDSFPMEFDLLAYGGKRDITNVKNSPLWVQIQKDGVLIYDQRSKTV
ncbi:MAG: nucleotidyltransferase domain-containing protein [Lachnospiraceae bacterium]|nr:nucleotidyltransferase domain-containing protein [Lachnospiraceae bacterium]